MFRRVAPLLLLLGLAVACGRSGTPEDQLRAVVAAAEQAAEQRDASALVDLVAGDYRDGYGNGADEIRRYLRGYLIAHQSIHLLVKIHGIELLAPDVARLEASVAMLGKEAEAASAWDLAATVYEFDLRLARENGRWRVTRAEWQRALGN